MTTRRMPAWVRVNRLFANFRYEPPPALMRDELTAWLLAYDEQRDRERQRHTRGRPMPRRA